MFGKVKRWLGIEGVKLELELPEKISRETGFLTGNLNIISMHREVVTLLKVSLIETYTRGRGKEKRIDDYELGSITQEKEIVIPPNEVISIPFKLPFDFRFSEIDALQEKNVFLKGVAKTAKWIYNAKSKYIVRAEAKVYGTALHPFDEKEIQIVSH